MSAPPLPFRLLAITRPGGPPDPWEITAAASAGGDRLAILLRVPGLDPDTLRESAILTRAICREHGASFLVHGDPALAREVRADGVHLPENGPPIDAAREAVGPHAWVGVSRHDLAGLRRARAADYATLSPIFPSPGKAEPLGLDTLRAACAEAVLPIVALGGVTPEVAADCISAGSAGVAAIGAVWTDDPAASVRALLFGIRAAAGM